MAKIDPKKNMKMPKKSESTQKIDDAFVLSINTLDLNYLRTFRAIFEEETVTAAAIRLNTPQSTVSSHLKKMRALFDDELFIINKSTNLLSPTEKGRFLSLASIKILKDVEQILDDGNAIAEKFTYSTPRTFHIVADQYAYQVLFPAYLDLQHQIATQIKYVVKNLERHVSTQEILSIQLDDLEFSLQSDLMITTEFFDRVELESEVLLHDEWVFVARKNHPFDTTIQSSLLSTLNLVLTDKSPLLSVVDLLNRTKQKDIKLNVIATVPSFFNVASSVARSKNLIGFIPKRIAESYQGEFALRIIEHTLETLPIELRLYMSRRKQSDPAIAWLKKSFKDICIRGCE